MQYTRIHPHPLLSSELVQRVPGNCSHFMRPSSAAPTWQRQGAPCSDPPCFAAPKAAMLSDEVLLDHQATTPKAFLTRLRPPSGSVRSDPPSAALGFVWTRTNERVTWTEPTCAKLLRVWAMTKTKEFCPLRPKAFSCVLRIRRSKNRSCRPHSWQMCAVGQ